MKARQTIFFYIFLFLLPFEVIFSQNGFKFISPDTISYSEKFICYIKFDSLKYGGCSDIKVLFLGNQLEKKNNTFVFEIRPNLPGENEYEFNVEIKGCKNIKDSLFTIKRVVFSDINKIKVKNLKKVGDEEAAAIKKRSAIFKSTKYKDFDEYIFDNLKGEKLSTKGKLNIVFIVTKKNQVKLEAITQGEYTKQDEEILKKVFQKCSYYYAGEEKGKKVDTKIIMRLDLSKVK